MALVKGTNCGFVTVAPTDDPGGSPIASHGFALAQKLVVPAGAATITEIGWWCDSASQEANWEGGLYTHNAGADNPDALIAGVSRTNAKGTTAGWKRATSLAIVPPAAGTTVWLTIQIDTTGLNTNVDRNISATGERLCADLSATTLDDPFFTQTALANTLYAIYAVYATASGKPMYAYAQQ